ncbi:hypothetical protein J4466_05940 [Candidatus Pacearchaeota archaeon]|nr:hypothetical protein [uncultured archaeon]AQS29334.1 hypothetical protein [uncultured archaeon]MBS3092929.1 hypothetical protein [Candidatus Pacearchaeota archaeon]
MELKTIRKENYRVLLELDKKVYPTDSPVTPRVLDQWYQRNPEFGMVYREKGKIVGLGIAIPLNAKAWKRLINGELAESDLNSETIFDNSKDKEIGIHVYHIEKLDKSIKEFHKTFLIDLSKIIGKLRIKNPNLEIIGFSGLCVTNEGIGLLSRKLTCKEREYKCNEYILEKDNKKIVFKADSKKELDSKIADGYKLINRCQMLVTYPGEKSIVWEFFK